MATTLEVVRGISQVMANSFDGALDKEDNPIKVGLKREKEYELNDRRIIDGFKVKLQGNKLILTYHSECKIKEVHNSKFEDEVETTISEVVKYLKREFKKVTGETLSLKQNGKMKMVMESSSMIRTWVVAQCQYEISNMETTKTKKRSVEKGIEDWLKLGKNDTRGY